MEKKMKKEYQSAPLPFMGQKRMYARDFKEVLKQFPDDAIYLDLFGGSGLLSHFSNDDKANATVIYNDYDNYRQRLDNIGRTNSLLAELRDMVKDYPRKDKLPSEIKAKILQRLEEEEKLTWMD